MPEGPVIIFLPDFLNSFTFLSLDNFSNNAARFNIAILISFPNLESILLTEHLEELFSHNFS